MIDMLDPLIDGIAIAVIKVVVAILTTAVTVLLFKLQAKAKTWLEARLTSEQMALLEGEAAKFVRYLQQAEWLDFTNEEKKEKAIVHLLQFCEKYNLPFDRDDIDAAIEAAVLTMKESYEKAKP